MREKAAGETQAHEAETLDLRELRELQRIMKAFQGELNKLEEGLRVLSAYVTRMKSRTPTDSPRVIH